MSTPYHFTPRMPAPPHPTPLSVPALSRPKATRAPALNPYDQLTETEFRAFIADITSRLRRALGQEEEELPYGQHENSPESEFAEDSFAEYKARKGKARDLGEGPGLGKGDRIEPIEIVSSDEEDAQEVELSMLSIQDEEPNDPLDEEDDARRYSEEEEEYSWEQGQSSSQILPPPRKARVEPEEEYEDEGEEEVYESGERGQYEEYQEEREEYDEGEENNQRRALQVASDDVIEIVDSDDEQEAVVLPPPRPVAQADYEAEEGYDEYDKDENYEENYRIGTSHLVRRDHGFIRRPRQYADEGGEEEEQEEIVEQEHGVIEDDDEIEEIQPVDADTSFPPKASLSPAQSNGPVELPDPWSGPRTYAEDFYSGGDIRVSSDLDLDVHHIGPMDAEPVEDVDVVSRRVEDEDPDMVQPMSEDISFPPQQQEADLAVEVDLPDPWEGPKTYAEDFYSGGDLRLPPSGQSNAHYMGPTDADYVEQVEPDVVLQIEVDDSDEVQPLSEDTSFPLPFEREEEERESLVELPDPWAGPQTYAEDFYSGGDVRPVPDHQIDPALLSGTADADDSIDNFLTPGVHTPNHSEERSSVSLDVPAKELGEEGRVGEEEGSRFIQPPSSQSIPATVSAASRRSAPIPADAEIINIDDFDDEEEEEEDERVAASSDIGDDEELDFMYPEFDEPPHQEDLATGEEIREDLVFDEAKEIPELEEDDIVPSPPPTVGASEQDNNLASESPHESFDEVKVEDFAEDQSRPAEPGIRVIEDEDEPEEQEAVSEEHHQPAGAPPSPPLISPPRLSEVPDGRSVGERVTPVEIVEEDDFDQLQDEAAQYVLPTEVVEPETASEYTVDEGSVLEEVVDAETEVEALAPAPEPLKEPEHTPEPEIAITTLVAEEEVKEERSVEVDEDEDEDDDMYMDEPPVEKPTEEIVAPVVEGLIETEQQQPQEQVPVEEMPSKVVFDVEVPEYEAVPDVESTQAAEEAVHAHSISEVADNVPEAQIQDIQSNPQPEQEAQESEDGPSQVIRDSVSVAGTQHHGQLPTPPSEGSRYVPLPPEDDGEDAVQLPSHNRKHRVEIEEILDEDAYIPRPILANTIDGEIAVDTSSQHEVAGYSVEEVEDGYIDDDADGEYEEDREHDISLMSVASTSDMLQRWDEDRDGLPAFEEPVTEGRLNEEPSEREMSLGVVSITSEAAAAFQGDRELGHLGVGQGTESTEGTYQSPEEGGTDIPSAEPVIAQEEAPLPQIDLASAGDLPSSQDEVVLEDQDAIPETGETPASDAAPFEDATSMEETVDEGLDYIETDKMTATDLPPISTREDVSLADEPPSVSPESDQIAANEEPVAQEIEAAVEHILEEVTPALDTDALADSTKEIIVSVPTVDSDFGWTAIQEPPMPITADPNVPDPVDHPIDSPSTILPVHIDEPTTTASISPAIPDTAEEAAYASISVPSSLDLVTQPAEAGSRSVLPVVPQALKQTDGLFTPAEPADGVPAGEQPEDKHSRALSHLAQAFFWPGSPPAYFGSPAFGNPSGTFTPNKAEVSLPDIMGAQPPLIPDPSSGAKQDVFGNVQSADGPRGSSTHYVNILASPTSTLSGAPSGPMSVPLTRRPSDHHILSADPYPYCLSTPGAPLYLGSDKASGEATSADADKGEGTSAGKASATEPTSEGGSSKQSSKRKREALSQRGKGRKGSKTERRKSQASKDAEPEALGDETIVVKSRPKEKKKDKAAEPGKRFPSELSQGSHSSSGASLARQILKPTSRASSIGSSAPSVGTQPSPTVNKPYIPRPPQPAPLPQATLLHAHGSRRKALSQTMSQPAIKAQTKKPQFPRAPAASRNVQQPPPTTPTHAPAFVVPSSAAPSTAPSSTAPAPSVSTSAPAEQPNLLTFAEKITPSPARQMSQPGLPNSTVTRSTRSHCRYHRISLPKEEGGPRVCFLVPGCSLNDKELMEEEEIVDHGDATQEDSQRMISDIGSLGFSLELIGVMRQLVGLDILREQEVFYLPQLGEEVNVPRRHFPRPSTSTRPGVKDSSSYAGSPDYSGSLRSPISNRPPDSTSTTFSVIQRFVDSEKGSTIASTDSESEATDDEEPASKKARPSPPEEQGVMGPPSTLPTDKKKHKGRRGKKADLTYKPEEEPEEVSGEEQSSSRKRRKSTALRGVKRTRTSEVAMVPEGDERESKKLRSHSTAPDPATPQQQATVT